jgi:mono/diheme cytochrome c family protein
MTRTFLQVFAFVLVVVGIYAYVGQLVPQFEEHPPKKRAITAETGREELVAIGRELVHGKGGCLICHKDSETGNERGPDLRQAFGKGAGRKPDMTAEAYLIESLVTPESFVVEGYPKIMPSALKPPANLSRAEVKAVVAYLQALGGGEPTVVPTAEDLAASTTAGGRPTHRGRALMDEHGCTGCHSVAGEGGEVGPDLTRVAEWRSPADLLRKIADPAAWTTEGFEAGVMPAFAEMAEGDRHEIVAFLIGLTGRDYSPTGAASPWSHEGVRLGLIVLIANLGMLAAVVIARGRERKGA